MTLRQEQSRVCVAQVVEPQALGDQVGLALLLGGRFHVGRVRLPNQGRNTWRISPLLLM